MTDFPQMTPDPLLIDPPEGIAYRWVVFEVRGEIMPSDLGLALEAGWRPVPVDRHPEVTVRGCVLMEKSSAEVEGDLAWEAANAITTEERRRAVIQSGYLLAEIPGIRVLTDDEMQNEDGYVLTDDGWVSLKEGQDQ